MHQAGDFPPFHGDAGDRCAGVRHRRSPRPCRSVRPQLRPDGVVKPARRSTALPTPRRACDRPMRLLPLRLSVDAIAVSERTGWYLAAGARTRLTRMKVIAPP